MLDQKLALRDDSLGLSAPRPGVRSRAGAARQNAVRRCIVHHATEDSLCGMGTTKRRRYSRAGCNPSDNFACVHFTQKETSVFVHARRRHCFVAGISRGVFLVCCTGQRSISRSAAQFDSCQLDGDAEELGDGHVNRFVLQLAALSLLVLSVVLETRENTTTV